MAKYRKKPIEIEALVWTGHNLEPMSNFLTENRSKGKPFGTEGPCFSIDFGQASPALIIKTSEGDMTASVGDYIIKEPFDKDRKFYPCKPDIFKLTYEEINE